MCTTTMNFIVVVNSMKVIMCAFTSGADSDFQLECIKIKLRGEGGGGGCLSSLGWFRNSASSCVATHVENKTEKSFIKIYYVLG